MIQVVTFRVAQDNLCHMVTAGGEAIVIDPTEAAPVLHQLSHRNLKLKLILNTHHHDDHIAGNHELKNHSGCEVFCSNYDLDRIPDADRGLGDSETFTFHDLHFTSLETPGHTLGQVAFHCADLPALFAGDTLFALGCGRVFEGTYAQMFASLQRLKSLPPQTKLYFGHEYSLRNADFALSLGFDREAIRARRANDELAIKESGFAPPPTLAIEMAINPFLLAETTQVFTRRRELRNVF